eukprot:CAMPEP_0185378062 /NCGR_PEP_ID=MMETSP1364-20130426/44017_1 /TAXON_ID=38817 /ORGANISM="Gephyrocapsa oceanica, Strain RCC1303" /LENGTH=48 /DNA_ID= /DNA_START= /DNA_END= /DNA_ORIENTATION=
MSAQKLRWGEVRPLEEASLLVFSVAAAQIAARLHHRGRPGPDAGRGLA